MSEHENKEKVGCEKCVCDECCAEISESSAMTPEGSDYVRHFCGQACYDKWQTHQTKSKGE